MTKNILPPGTTPILENPNFLSPNKFKLVVPNFPELEAFQQRIVLPTITMGQNIVGTNTHLHYTRPGDTLEYDDLIISFIVDEDLISYRRIKKWQEDVATRKPQDTTVFSDLEVVLLTNNTNKNISFKFKDAWPYLISTILLDTTQGEDQPLTIDVNFKYTTFDILPTLPT